MELSGIVTRGSRRQALEALRDKLAQVIDDSEGYTRDVVAAVKELRAVLAEIDSLAEEKKESAIDELANRRDQRRANTINACSAGG